MPLSRLNCPLKSTHQTTLGAFASVSSPKRGGLVRRLTLRTSPAASRIRPKVLTTGHSISGFVVMRLAWSFFGPQVGCRPLKPTISLDILDCLKEP